MTHTEKTSTGLDANVAGALCYLLGFVTGIVFLVIEKENKFVRFHAMQSTVFFAGLFVLDIVLQVIPFIGFLFVIFLVFPATVIAWLFLMYKAYQGEEFKLPIVGQFAADKI